MPWTAHQAPKPPLAWGRGTTLWSPCAFLKVEFLNLPFPTPREALFWDGRPALSGAEQAVLACPKGGHHPMQSRRHEETVPAALWGPPRLTADSMPLCCPADLCLRLGTASYLTLPCSGQLAWRVGEAPRTGFCAVPTHPSKTLGCESLSPPCRADSISQGLVLRTGSGTRLAAGPPRSHRPPRHLLFPSVPYPFHPQAPSRWQLHPSSCSGHKPWRHPCLLSVSHTLHPTHQDFLLALPSKYIRSPSISHTCTAAILARPLASLPWTTAMAFQLFSLLPLVPTSHRSITQVRSHPPLFKAL